MKMIGRTILHYKILEKLGEGGMGVVYKALDTKLNREVAIKFLPYHIASGEEERKRFKIEAQAAAALNHPNISTIHAIEEIDGETFIVMEYIKGRELKDIINSSFPNFLNLRKVLEYAIQIAEGLNAAHKEGVIHRDIKSANIMITEKDQVKIMDFGLAKVCGGAQLTKDHSILGTAAYMSPEQALGEKKIGYRTDIWSFGVILYEMLTGQFPFQGEYDSAIIYAIVNEKYIPITEKRPDTPIEIEHIIDKCLQKDKKNRYHLASHLVSDLKKLKKSIDSDKSSVKVVLPLRKLRRGLLASILIAAALVLATAFLVIGYNLFHQAGGEPKIVHARALTTTMAAQEVYPQISPDGTKVAYNSDEEGKWDLIVRQISSGQTLNLTKDEKGRVGGQAWSPDGNWIAFASTRDGGGIYVISEYGGIARRIVAQSIENLGRINWSPDGKKLVYIEKGKLYTVLASGGEREHIPLPRDARDPAWSPDGERIVLILGSELFVEKKSLGPLIKSGIWTIRPDGSDAIAVFDNPEGLLFSPTWANDGKRIFFKWNQKGTRDLWWVPVEKNGKPLGSARPLTAGLNTYDFSLTKDGSKLAYTIGGMNVNIWSLPLGAHRMLTMNNALQITYENQFVSSLAMSPDHKWLAFNSSRFDGLSNIWMMHKDGQNFRQLTADSSHNFYPSWSPDGSRIAFSSDQTGNMEIYLIPVNGGPATALTADPAVDAHPSWSPDGEEIVFHSNRSGNFDLWVTSIRGGEKKRQLTNDQADDIDPSYSPDGRFISFLSKREGVWDVYLLPVGGGDPIQLTHLGAKKIMGHVWSLDGKIIYIAYHNSEKDEIWAVSVDDGSMNKILDYQGNTFESISQPLATDGERLFFIVARPFGDIWLAELGYK